MSNSDQPDPSLKDQAFAFAAELDDTLRRVVPDVPPVTALLRTGEKRGRLHVAPRADGDPPRVATVPLTIAGKHRLNLRIEMWCASDHIGQYLAITKSTIAVETLGEGTRSQPLFRFEYERDQVSSLPAAHLHIHAHRDETTWMMTLGDRGRAAQRDQAERMPLLSSLHFPLGGHRFRPCTEDVLEMIIEEFGVRTVDEHWREVLRQGRTRWRHRQLQSVVRDSPRDAAEVLDALGWTITPPPGMPNPISSRLTAL